MDDPDMILSIDRYADRLTEKPIVRQRFGPQRVHFKHWHLNCGSLDSGIFFEHRGPKPESNEGYDKSRANTEITTHISRPHISGCERPLMIYNYFLTPSVSSFVRNRRHQSHPV